MPKEYDWLKSLIKPHEFFLENSSSSNWSSGQFTTSSVEKNQGSKQLDQRFARYATFVESSKIFKNIFKKIFFLFSWSDLSLMHRALDI